jgi:hypothetical protein
VLRGGLSRDAVALDGVTALDIQERLARVGPPATTPSRSHSPAYQRVGERL